MAMIATNLPTTLINGRPSADVSKMNKVGLGRTITQLVPSAVNREAGKRRLQVQCMATNDGKGSTDFKKVFAFSGPAPETINGRLAMVGFMSAVGVEIATGQDLFSQLREGGLNWFVIAALLFSAASLIPMFKGVSAESRSQRVMSSEAETLNGRFAMLGLVALALTEYMKGGPLV